ncbi:hypothetical protein HK414_04525 [Ramlibacter terrae]|uniref:Transposase n=1 Tax=Ramlibacter terrae TaxID=2732511 RepID=A0ABX6P0L6_9BURK|nr:hypothetical protein HK414_04525 [Ramlibacter terrae]
MPAQLFRARAPAAIPGEFLDAAQAVCVARMRYPHVHGCPCCGGDEPPQHWVAMPLAAARFPRER